MVNTWFSAVAELMQRGGPVMWPLAVLSVVALTLVLERAWFFIGITRRSVLKRADAVSAALRRGAMGEAKKANAGDATVYGDLSRRLMEELPTDAAVADALEHQRQRLERFLPTLSTIITAAPMLGILGTVLGIIGSFEALSDQAVANDPRVVGAGIAEALITTAAGLTVALVTLLPYNALRAQVDRAQGRLEAIAASAQQGRTQESGDRKPEAQTGYGAISSS
jgi:biopolymer transport protein ExbB